MNDPVPIHLPTGYHEVLYWKLSHHKKLLIALNVAGLGLMVVAGVLSLIWASLWHPTSYTSKIGLDVSLLLVVSPVLIIVAHELVHGLALKAYDARPKYGILWEGLMFYATAPNYSFHRNHYLVIALAPLVGLSVLGGLLLMVPLSTWARLTITLCVAVNAGGAVGDLWLTRVALGYPAHAYIVDEQDGMRVFMPVEGT